MAYLAQACLAAPLQIREQSVPTAVRNMQVYIHPPPGYSYAPDSMFAGMEVPNRVVVQWAQFSVVRHVPLHASSALAAVQLWMLAENTWRDKQETEAMPRICAICVAAHIFAHGSTSSRDAFDLSLRVDCVAPLWNTQAYLMPC